MLTAYRGKGMWQRQLVNNHYQTCLWQEIKDCGKDNQWTTITVHLVIGKYNNWQVYQQHSGPQCAVHTNPDFFETSYFLTWISPLSTQNQPLHPLTETAFFWSALQSFCLFTFPFFFFFDATDLRFVKSCVYSCGRGLNFKQLPLQGISCKSRADLGGGCRGCPPPPQMTFGSLIQLIFRKICRYVWYICILSSLHSVHVMLLPSQKPSSKSLLKFVYVTSQFCSSSVVHPR